MYTLQKSHKNCVRHKISSTLQNLKRNGNILNKGLIRWVTNLFKHTKLKICIRFKKKKKKRLWQNNVEILYLYNNLSVFFHKWNCSKCLRESTISLRFKRTYFSIASNSVYCMFDVQLLKNIQSRNRIIEQTVRTSLKYKYNQQDATFSRYIYFYKLLYMFQAVSPPIIRSTKLYIQRQVLSS
jgi:hypothetical protein